MKYDMLDYTPWGYDNGHLPHTAGWLPLPPQDEAKRAAMQARGAAFRASCRQRAVQVRGIACLCPECLGTRTDDNALLCPFCAGTGSVLALPVVERAEVEELPV